MIRATFILVILLSAVSRADIIIERLDGPVTPAEVASFKQHIKTLPMPTSNKGNAMVYGSAGSAAEALGDVYQITNDREVLDLLIQFADHMLAGRNDPENGRVTWTGKRELCWPNGAADRPDAGYSGTENGDVMAHIAYAARCILKTKSLWDEKLGIEDKFNFGPTYLQRAKTYIRECDRTMDSFLLPHWLDPKTNRQRWPESERFGKLSERHQKDSGKPVPWNQQAMIDGALQRLAVCHEILGDDPQRVSSYDSIVKASLDWFFSEVTKYQVDGRDCYKWSYVAEGQSLRHVEDVPHAGYDVLLICRAWSSGRYGLTREQVLPIANTIMYVVNKREGKFARRIDGTDGTRDYFAGSYFFLAEFVPELYQVIANAGLKRAKTSPELAARLLWAKHWRNVGKFPSQVDTRR
jgi:hypothetical protein